MSPGDGLPSRRRLTCPGLEQGNGERRDAFASSNEAHALVGFRLDRRPVRVNAHRRSELPLHPGDVIVVRRAAVSFQLVRLPGHSYYKTLNQKLGWGGQPRYQRND